MSEFHDLDRRVAVLEQIAADVRETLHRIDGRLDRLETRFDERLDRLETRFDERLDRLDAKLDRLDDKLNRELGAFRVELTGLHAFQWSQFRWLMGVMLGGFAGLLGVMAHGFHWL